MAAAAADDKSGPLGQPEQRRPIGGLLDGHGRKVDPDQPGAEGLG